MRKEYPRPQFYRKDWLNLNGKWSCDFSKNIKGFLRSKINKKRPTTTFLSLPDTPGGPWGLRHVPRPPLLSPRGHFGSQSAPKILRVDLAWQKQ